jgi:hypothetical protein
MQIKAEVTITYVYDVETDDLEEAITLVEDGDAEDCVETDSSMPRVVEYTIPGQLGWNTIKDAACEDCDNNLNDGSDICDQCGGIFK